MEDVVKNLFSFNSSFIVLLNIVIYIIDLCPIEIDLFTLGSA
jgi:hypothetical protein